MRKTIRREVTKTTIKLARMEVVDGAPVAVPLQDELMLGNVSLEKAQKEMKKLHGEGVTVFGVEPDTQVYELEVTEFLKIARLVKSNEDVEEEELQEA